MPRQRMTVELEAHDMSAREDLAAHDGRTVNELVTIAVSDYIDRRPMDDSEWKKRWDTVIADLRSSVLDDVNVEEIEAEVRAARAEYREQRRARNG